VVLAKVSMSFGVFQTERVERIEPCRIQQPRDFTDRDRRPALRDS
jgi:hypothetical protein